MKDDSGAYAVFVEQGSSAAQMTAAKVMDVVARLLDCDGQAADAISAYTQVKRRMLKKLLNTPKSECPDIWIRLPKHKWTKSWEYIEDPVVPLERNLYGHPLAGLLWERQVEKALLELGWVKVPNRECLLVHRKQKLFLSVCVDDIKMAGRSRILAPMWKKLMKDVDIEEPTSFLDHVFFVLHSTEMQTQRENRWTRQQHVRIPYFCWRAWSHDVEGHARKCVERYCELANEKTEQLYKVSHPCLDDHQIRKEELEMLVLGTKWST